jgi:serine O-acetyltransferase
MNQLIKSDLYRYIPFAFSTINLIKGFRSQGFRYMFFRRLVELHGRRSIIGVVSKLMLHHYTGKYGFQIGGKIGAGFYIGHFGTIIVSNNAIIGENCNIAPGVTIGASRRGEKKGAPVLGDYVWIGTNAIIVGAVKIGSDVLIAPGAYVNFDVPGHSIVIGNPGKIIPRENATEGHINNVWEGK